MVEPLAGDLLCVLTAGAYGAVQSGTYNARPLIPEVLVDGARSPSVADAKRRGDHRNGQRP